MHVLAALLALTVAAKPNPSVDRLPLSNGFGAAVVDDTFGHLVTLTTRPYAERSKGKLTPDVALASSFGVSWDGGPGTWLSTTPATSVRWEAGTGLLVATHAVGPLAVETTWLAPWGLERPAVVMVARVTNTSALSPHAVTVAAYLDYHLGLGTPVASEKAERIELTAPATWLESGKLSQHRMVYRAVPTPNQLAATPKPPYAAFAKDGKLPPAPGLGDVLAPVDADDATAGFARGPLDLAPGASLWMAVVAAYGTPADQAGLAAEVDAWIGGRDPEQIVADERAAWQAWAAADAWEARALEAGGGAAVSPDELAVWRQGLAILRMSQVREANADEATPRGQIVASLTPGVAQRAVPRDLAYAAVALARTGFPEEAWEALRFVLAGRAGGYAEELGVDDYLVSVDRYYGDGGEASTGDPEAEGPNLSLDGFGLVLWALGEWADGQDGLADLEPYWPDVQARVADVLVALVDPALGLLAADSGPWEVHSNGRERRFAFTNVAAAAGLCAASRIAARLGDSSGSKAYEAAARGFRDAVVTELRDPLTGGLAGNLEELVDANARDASVVEAINWGLVPADGPVADATLDLLEALRVAEDRGYARSDDETWADEQEHVWSTLRIAAARALRGEDDEADALVTWVRRQARANDDLVPELYAREDAAYEGAVPRSGLGVAAFALARLAARPVMDEDGCLPWTPPVPPGDAGPEEEPDAGPEPVVEPAPEDGPDAGDATPDGAKDTGPVVPPDFQLQERGGGGGCAGGGAGGPLGLGLAALGLALVSRRRGRRRRGRS